MENHEMNATNDRLNSGHHPEFFTFHHDSVHGWMEVPIALLKKLGLEHAITHYSYISWDGLQIYLEEDYDLMVFLKVYEEHSGISVLQILKRCKESYQQDSFVMELPRYTGWSEMQRKF